MRRRLFLVAMVVLGCGLLVLRVWRAGDPHPTRGHGPRAAHLSAPGPSPHAPPEKAGPTRPLAQAPSESDGVLEVEVLAGGQPWPGATVRLYARPEADTWRLVGTGTTDARGGVRLASPPGGYLVAVRAQGHAPLLRDVVRPFGEPRTVLRLSLAPGQSLTGHTVVAGTRQPLPLVELVLTAHGRALEPWQRADAPDEERVWATSDERGRFLVAGLAPGSYLLEARAPGHARAVLQDVRVPSEGPLTVELRGASVIEGFVVDAQGLPAAHAEVRTGDASTPPATTGAQGGFSLEVQPGAHTVSARRGDEAGGVDAPVLATAGSTVRDVRIRLGPGAVLEGRVVAQSSGAPVPGARVDVRLAGAKGDAGHALTDGEGHFRVKGLAAGSYDARAAAPGFSPASRHGLTVGPGEHFSVHLPLPGTGTVEGQVKDGAGQPVAGARVTGVTGQVEPSDRPQAESRTDATGHYRLEGLIPGRVYLTARREGSDLGVHAQGEVRDTGTSRVDFTLAGTGTVEGQVRARGPLPTAPLAVTAISQTGSTTGLPDIGRVTVGREGDFRMVLPPGTYLLLLGTREGRTLGGQQEVRVEEGRTARVELSWEEPQDMEEFRGIVLEPDGVPSPGAMVTLTREGGAEGGFMMVPADDGGRFIVRQPRVEEAAPRPARVSAHHGGRASEPQRAEPGREVVVKLRPAASIRGRVVGGDAPVRGFTLHLQLQKGYLPEGHGPWEFPGERFELKDVPAEPVRLLALTTEGLSGEVLLSPQTGASLEVEIALKATASVRGRLVDRATRAPVPRAFLYIEGALPPAPHESDLEGRFSIDGLLAGPRTLVIIGGPAQAGLRRALKLTEGEALDLGDVALEGPRPPSP